MCGAILCGLMCCFLFSFVVYGTIFLYFIDSDEIYTDLLWFYWYIFKFGVILLVYFVTLYSISRNLFGLALAFTYEKKKVCESIIDNKSTYLLTSAVKNFIIGMSMLFLATYLDSYYLKIPCSLYVCNLFGLAASFPIQNKLYDSSSLTNELVSKSIKNTIIFVIMFAGYEIYVNKY